MSYSTPNNGVNRNYFAKLLNAPKQDIQKNMNKRFSPCQLNFTNNNVDINPIVSKEKDENITPEIKKIKIDN